LDFGAERTGKRRSGDGCQNTRHAENLRRFRESGGAVQDCAAGGALHAEIHLRLVVNQHHRRARGV
jgi:hypothetical protein